MPLRRLVRSMALLVLLSGTLRVAVADAAPPDRALDTSDAVLRPAVTSAARTLDPVQGCRAVVTRSGDCTVAATAHGYLVVTVEPGRRIDDVLASRPWTVRVYRPTPGVADGWELALATRPEDGSDGPLFAAVTAKAVDVTLDGTDELVVGYRSEGTGMILDVDIVGTDPGGAPRVLGHDQLYKGNVVFRHGRLVAWAPVYKRTDANCCPTWIQRSVLEFRDGGFSVDAGPRIGSRRADIPPSELG